MYSNLAVPLIILLLFSSCSVCEDRALCPCLLAFDFALLDTAAVMASGDSTLCWHVSFFHRLHSGNSEGLLPVINLPGRYELEIPRDSVNVAVVVGDEGLYLPYAGLIVPEGCEFPRLWLSAHTIDASGDAVTDTVLLRKEHALVYLHMKRSSVQSSDCSLSGGTAGCDARGCPVSGPYRVDLQPDGKGRCQACVPRQSDDSLRLDILWRDGQRRSLPIGYYLADSGYDWTAPDLEDIVVEVDYALTSVTISTDSWKRTLSFTIVV